MSGQAILNLGLIGYGRMGQGHAATLATHLGAEARLFAVAEPDAQLRALAQSQQAPQHVLADVDALLALPGLDAVLIVTPTTTHADVIAAAAAARKPIFCEKPLSLSLDACRAARDAVTRAGVPLQIGFMRRFDPAYAEAKQCIAAGEIGTPLLFKGVGRDNACPRPHYADPARSGGLIFDMGIHDVDLARWLMGDEIESVSTLGALLACDDLKAVGDIDTAVINMRYTRGALGNIDTGRCAFYGYDIRHEVLGSDGTIIVGSHANAPLLLKKTRDTIDAFAIPDRFGDAYVAQLAHFVACVRAGRMPAVDANDGLAASEVCVAANISLRENRAVALTEVR
jgi:scyllo-inositol 2-dehydrogenase (NAD+)